MNMYKPSNINETTRYLDRPHYLYQKFQNKKYDEIHSLSKTHFQQEFSKRIDDLREMVESYYISQVKVSRIGSSIFPYFY